MSKAAKKPRRVSKVQAIKKDLRASKKELTRKLREINCDLKSLTPKKR